MFNIVTIFNAIFVKILTENGFDNYRNEKFKI